MILKDKKIVFIDDDLSILKSYNKWCSKVYKDNLFEFYSEYKTEYITKYTDIVVFDFYIGNNLSVPNAIREVRKKHPNIFILVASSAVVIRDGNFSCYNNNLLKDSMEAGANNVIQKDISNVLDLIESHFIVRKNKTQSK
jgi:DNA-binding NtrC family response regulator